MAHKKLNLPEKICEHCQRPFAWRKKWQRCWQDVKYCSDACRALSKKKKHEHKAAQNLCAAAQVEDEF